MARCLRIFGAYTFRLSRRHSTLLLMFSFVATLTFILKLYTYRHHDHPDSRMRVGDFDYRPGAFLKGVQPDPAVSYCDFNYGLPEKLNWNSLKVFSPPKSGNKSTIRVIYNAIKGTAYANVSRFNAVTYATQATPELLYHIVQIARYWDGPISLSVFVPKYDLQITMQIMKQLCHCYPGMAKVSLHLFFPKDHKPKLYPIELPATTTEVPSTTTFVILAEILRKRLDTYRTLDAKTRAQYIQWVRQKKIERMMMKHRQHVFPPKLKFEDCSGFVTLDTFTYRREHSMVYPINVGRNTARNASTTNYLIVSDIEMVPSDGLATKFLTMVRKLMGDKKRNEGCVFAKTVFVVPTFEVGRGEDIPRDKDTLVRLVAESRATYFHQWVCTHCQKFPGLQTWLSRPSTNTVEPILLTRREYPYNRWEPLYFGTHKEPWYNEELTWEGKQDKMPQMLEMCLQEYLMVVLDGGFLCHAASLRQESQIRQTEYVMNNQRYRRILADLKRRYPDKPGCKVTFGCKQCKKNDTKVSRCCDGNTRTLQIGLCKYIENVYSTDVDYLRRHNTMVG